MIPALAALPLLLAPQDSFATGLVRSVELGAPPGTHVQYFRLEREGGRDAAPLGWLRYVSGTSRAGRSRVELELEFASDCVRLIQVEEFDASTRRLTYRELGRSAGRTLVLEGALGGPLAGYELGGTQVVRRATAGGGELALALLDGLRAGASGPAAAAVFDPLTLGFEPLTLTSRPVEDGREHEARRGDGSLRWRAVTRGGELCELRFQERGPVARPISAAEYERLRGEHELAERAIQEAASPLAGLRRARGIPER